MVKQCHTRFTVQNVIAMGCVFVLWTALDPTLATLVPPSPLAPIHMFSLSLPHLPPSLLLPHLPPPLFLPHPLPPVPLFLPHLPPSVSLSLPHQ